MSEAKTVGQLLGLKKKLPPVTEETVHDEVVAQALGITARMRQEIAHWRERAEAAEGMVVVEQRDNERLRTHIDRLVHDHERELSVLKIDNVHLHALVSRLEGMFNAGSKVFLEAFDELKRETVPDPTASYAPKPETVRAMERALAVDDGNPIPDFLTKSTAAEQAR